MPIAAPDTTELDKLNDEILELEEDLIALDLEIQTLITQLAAWRERQPQSGGAAPENEAEAEADQADEPLERLIARPAIRARLADGLAEHNRANPGGATRIARVLLMTEPAAIDASEIIDKGYINQRAVLARRADLVERLYAEPTADDVLTIG